jgi:hypothetical protein
LKALANVPAFTRPEFFDESRSVMAALIDEGSAYPIREEDFGLLDAARFAGEAKDLKGWIIRCDQIQSSV